MQKQQVLLIHGGTSYKNQEQYIQALKAKEVNLEWIQSRKN